MTAKTPQQKMQTFRGKIENVHQKPTRSGLAMVLFTVNGFSFKAFGDHAHAVRDLEGHEAEITAKHNTFRGKDEYAVATIAGEAGGKVVAVCGTEHSSHSNPLALKHPGRHSGDPRDLVQRWIMRFIDELTDEEWRVWSTDPRYEHDRIWPTYPGETREHRSASALMPPWEEEARLPDVKTRFESRLKEVRMAVYEKSNAEPLAMPI